jgi:hypothetical protein
VEISEIAIALMHMVEREYPLESVIADYKKTVEAISVAPTVGKTSPTGGRQVPVVSQQQIQVKLAEAARMGGSAVTSTTLQSF